MGGNGNRSQVPAFGFRRSVFSFRQVQRRVCRAFRHARSCGHAPAETRRLRNLTGRNRQPWVRRHFIRTLKPARRLLRDLFSMMAPKRQPKTNRLHSEKCAAYCPSAGPDGFNSPPPRAPAVGAIISEILLSGTAMFNHANFLLGRGHPSTDQ